MLPLLAHQMVSWQTSLVLCPRKTWLSARATTTTAFFPGTSSNEFAIQLQCCPPKLESGMEFTEEAMVLPAPKKGLSACPISDNVQVPAIGLPHRLQ